MLGGGKAMNSDNDIHSPKFQSKMDSYFTSKEKEAKGSYYTRWGKDDARSALALTKPIKNEKPS
jgi:hypothetical protein